MKIINRRASYDYQLLDHFEAGVDLLGAEVKPVKAGHADLTGSFVKIIGLQAYLVNARVFPYQYARPESYDEKRTRKLLLHKKQILSLKSKMEGGSLTIVPISLYTTHNLIKIELALAKSKKEFQKKAALKKQVLDREMEEALKGNY
jgi:SsrA-binding protein